MEKGDKEEKYKYKSGVGVVGAADLLYRWGSGCGLWLVFIVGLLVGFAYCSLWVFFGVFVGVGFLALGVSWVLVAEFWR